MRHLRRVFLPCLLLTGLLAVTVGMGCALLESAESRRSQNLLTPLTAPKDAIELEVFFVTRVAGDPQIGAGLWNQLQAITVVDPSVRDRLQQHGFRFAMSPSVPPQALQSLIALSTTDDPSRRVLMRKYVVPAGQDAVLVANAIPPGTKVKIPLKDGVRSLEVDQGACMFRVRAVREANDWARLELTPEIQYGDHSLRPKANDHEFLMDHGPRSVKLYEDRLTVELNQKELVVLGLSSESPEALGHRFFRSEADGREFEGLIVIRLARISRVEGQAESAR